MATSETWRKAATAASAAALVAGVVCLWRKQKRRDRQEPGPPGFPLIGHAPFMMRPDAHRILTKWANEYGGIYRLNVAGTTHVISDAKIANLVLTTRGEEGKFLKAKQVYEPLLRLTFGVPSIFNTTVEDEQYQAWRKLILQCFNNDNLKAILPIVRSCANNLVAQWQEFRSGSMAVDLEDWLQRCFLDIIHEAGFGMPGNAVLGGPNEFLHVVHDTLLQVTPVLFNPLLSLLYRVLPFCTGARRLRAAMTKWTEQFDGLLEEFRSRDLQPEDKRIWAQIMRARDPSTGLPFPDKIMSGQIATMLVGGFDTSSWTSVWALYDIARRPDIQKRIAHELADAGLLQVQGQPRARQIEWADLSLPYFNAVIKESMRMHPVAATGSMRVAPHDMELGGYSIQKGEKLWVLIHGLQNSVINFTEPEKFDPERWMKAELGSKDDTANGSASCPFSKQATPAGHAESAAASMVPFSAGPRSCVGLGFANMTLRVALLSVLSNFWLELDPCVGTHEEVEAQQTRALVLTSGRPMKVHLNPHM